MMFRLTPVVKFIIITVVAVYLFTIVAYNMGSPWADVLALRSIDSGGFKFYQLFTYMFSHSTESFMHILFNMFLFAMFGPQLEEFLGPKRFGNFIIIAGIGVGACWLGWQAIAQTTYESAMHGFSGVLMGIFSLMGLYFPDRNVRPYGLFDVKLKYLVLGYILLEFYSMTNGSNDNVSHISHLLGVLFAVIMFKAWEIIDHR